MNKIFRSSKFLCMILKETTIILYQIIKAKDPCKNCIVSPCCTEECNEKLDLDYLLKGHDLTHHKKIAWFTAIYFPFALAWILYQFIKTFF